MLLVAIMYVPMFIMNMINIAKFTGKSDLLFSIVGEIQECKTQEEIQAYMDKNGEIIGLYLLASIASFTFIVKLVYMYV